MNRRVLADINLLFALAFKASTQHHYANDWLNTMSQDAVIVCRNTQNGFLRLLTTPAAMRADAQTMNEAWHTYDTLMADARFSFWPEPDGVEEVWRALCASRQVSPKKWNDAYLAAFAIAAGLQLATFDRGFRDFPGLDMILLGPAAVHEAEPIYEID